MRQRILAAMVASTLAGLLIPLLAGPAAAHEATTVGKYHFVVGFGDEPAYAGEKNSVQLLLADANDKPVTDLTDTLKVEVSTGDTEPLALSMEPFFEVGEFGTPGDYRGFFIPTAPAATASTSPAPSRARGSTRPSSPGPSRSPTSRTPPRSSTRSSSPPASSWPPGPTARRPGSTPP
ncbi:MAG: hypothetical protein ACJ75N_00755 [Actinomycetes bacterium]